ncbi:uncharacterized protein LOC131671654 [Phymastichus coffea]|uniref:uncharacterized protein LOC131671654 n=1 Tax=Phymastichus coffea TaxID=108790 RepID=UPI00273B4E76|nr:uncharacterized protein LOC131671654 [Phymastichus coffea]
MQKSKLETNIKQSKMYTWNLMQVDDICKILILDPFIGFITRKIYKNSVISDKQQNIIKEEIAEFSLQGYNNRRKLKDNLINFVKSEKLYMQFNIKNLAWLDSILMAYIIIISKQSTIEIHECNRYKGDNYKGLMAKAKVDIPKGTLIKELMGFYNKVDSKVKAFLETQNLDFSIMHSSRTNSDLVMLGPAAFINHDCKPNCIYLPNSKNTIIIKAIKNIQAGDELFCYYGCNYFGETNKDCACATCEKKKEGIFKSINKNSSKKCEEKIVDVDSIEDAKKIKTLCNYYNKKIDCNLIAKQDNLLENLSTANINEIPELSLVINKVPMLNDFYDLWKILILKPLIKCNISIVLENNMLTRDIQISIYTSLAINDIHKKLNSSTNCENATRVSNNHSYSEQLLIKEVDSTYSLWQNHETTKISNQISSESDFKSTNLLLQCCNTCCKGIVSNVTNNIWHNSKCGGTIIKRSNSVPYVLIKRPEPIPKRRRPFCHFCAAFVHQYPRHLITHHSSEPKVKQIITPAGEIYNNRSNALTSLRNRGCDVYYKFTGKAK